MWKKIMVIGCPGAGKSTYARKLRDITNLPLYYLDMIWHKPDKTNISREEFDSRVKEILNEDAWIIDGNYQRTMEIRMKACDAIFFLDIPLEICYASAEARIGQEREDMPWVEDEFDEEFKQWILDFPKRDLGLIYELLEKYKGEKQVVIFKSREEADEYLEKLSL